MPRSHYELLGVSQSADAMTLRRAFRSLSKTLHPDTTSLPADVAALRFQKVCEAYQLLSDPIRRHAYDKSMEEVNLIESTHIDEVLHLTKKDLQKRKIMEVRRSLSGGELLSLLLLVLTLVVSSFLALGFALAQGRELQNRPSWLIIDHHEVNVSAPFGSMQQPNQEQLLALEFGI